MASEAHDSRSEMTPAQRGHTRRVIWLLVIYAIVLPPLLWVHNNTAVRGSISVIMAIVASLPVLAIFASWGRYISEERDEYHHSLVLRRIAVATNVTMAAAVVWGFLQAFDVMPLVPAYWLPVVWVVAQGLPAIVNKLFGQP